MKKTTIAALLALATQTALARNDTLPDEIADTNAVRQFVVVNMESKVPVQDILVYTDDGQETKTKLDGTFSLRETFGRVNFVHPSYEKRYMLREELEGDTIGLLPHAFALNEVVVYGHRPDHALGMNFKLSEVEAQLLRPVPTGFNILGLLDKIWFSKVRHRKEMEKQKRKMIIDNY